MTITPTGLIRAAGLAAMASGALFIGVQVGHPHMDASTIDTTEVIVRDVLKVAMGTLALVGITGMYARQVRRAGLLGLVGYLVLSLGYLLIVGTVFAAAFVLPGIADANPAFVNDAAAVMTGNSPVGDVGLLGPVATVQQVAYLLGGLVFGIALVRARVLSRWASALLALGGVVTIALSFMPDAFYRLLAFPNGIAMIALGWSLWRSFEAPGEDASGSATERPVAAEVPSR